MLTRGQLKKTLGTDVQADVPSKMSLTEAQRLYDVYHVVIEQGDHCRSHDHRVKASWREMLGQKVIHLADYQLLAETVVSAIQVAEGADHSTAAKGWGAGAQNVIERAVASLPRGVPAARRLGA